MTVEHLEAGNSIVLDVNGRITITTTEKTIINAQDNVEVNCDKEVIVTCDKIKLGDDGADQSTILGERFQELFNNHTHNGSPPNQKVEQFHLSKIVKNKP